jgi:lipopolysaccharide/colanic/teichoic acid biosynthesis glycosyltransferase
MGKEAKLFMFYKIKRVLDIIISLFGILILFPFFVLVAFAIKVESKGPVIFKQERIGLNGRVFNIYKFRSMCVGAEKSGVYERKGDTRVTKVGKFIRKTSIDEFPQLVNILRGDMSIIGPRPTLTYHPWPYQDYTTMQKKRFAVRPGVTGWAQIKGRKDVPWDKRIEYDLYYVRNCSLLLDFRIFFVTIFKVLLMKDNYNIGETALDNKNRVKGNREDKKQTKKEVG